MDGSIFLKQAEPSSMKILDLNGFPYEQTMMTSTQFVLCFVKIIFINCPRAVSYTHLDVYKRQAAYSTENYILAFPVKKYSFVIFCLN